jgi:hypothetical protein
LRFEFGFYLKLLTQVLAHFVKVPEDPGHLVVHDTGTAPNQARDLF